MLLTTFFDLHFDRNSPGVVTVNFLNLGIKLPLWIVECFICMINAPVISRDPMKKGMIGLKSLIVAAIILAPMEDTLVSMVGYPSLLNRIILQIFLRLMLEGMPL